ncbi:MAG: hypothetical protein ACKVT0_18950 [Planctomycetaceae bacterium]
MFPSRWLRRVQGQLQHPSAKASPSRRHRKSYGISHAAFISTEGLEQRILLVAPANDNFADSVAIIGDDVTVFGTNVDATKEAGEPDHAGDTGGHSVWWNWTPTFTGLARVDTIGSDFDTLLAVYTGVDVGLLIEIESDDDGGPGLQSRLFFNAVALTTYQIAVDGFSGDVGNITLNVLSAPIPANDDFADRELITGNTATLLGTNFNSSKELGEPDHAGDTGGNSVWWTWTAPFSGTAEIDTEGSDFDTLLGVYTGGNVAALTEIASDDDGGFSNQSKVTIAAIAGATYQIAVDGFGGDQGDIVLNVALSTLTIDGTNGDDEITVDLHDPNNVHVIVNGVESDINTSGLDRIEVHGMAGDDILHVIGTMGNDDVTLNPGMMEFAGPAFTVGADSFSYIDVKSGGGEDRASLFDSAGEDQYIASPMTARLVGTGFDSLVEGFRRVYAYSYAVGFDTARLFDSAGNDNFTGDPIRSRLFGNGYHNSASRFEQVEAFASTGNDTTTLFDSPGNDLFQSYENAGMLSGVGFDNRGLNFDRVYGSSYVGGTDEAHMHDSTGDDRFVGREARSIIFSDDYYASVSRFEEVFAIGFNGGNDRADLHGTPGNDNVVADPDRTRMSGSGYYLEVIFFEMINAYAGTGGNDTVTINDSTGNDDFLNTPQGSFMTWSNGRKLSLYGFDSVVVASSLGGSDTAEFLELSTLDAVFAANDTASVERSSGTSVSVKGFARVRAGSLSAPGPDLALASIDFSFIKIGEWI